MGLETVDSVVELNGIVISYLKKGVYRIIFRITTRGIIKLHSSCYSKIRKFVSQRRVFHPKNSDSVLT